MAPFDIVSTLIGAGAVAPGQACAILGTTLCVGAMTDRVDTDGAPAGFTLAAGADGHCVRAYATMAGTDVVDWAVSLLGLETPSRLSDLAAEADPWSHRLLFLPYLSPAGERAPFLDPEARGALLGLTVEHRAPDIARAVLEGLTFVLHECLLASVPSPRPRLERCYAERYAAFLDARRACERTWRRAETVVTG